MLMNEPIREPKDPDTISSTGTIRCLRAVAVAVIAIGIVAALVAPVSLPARGVHIEIPEGSGSRAIGALLRERGLIRSPWAFVTYATLVGKAATLKPGSYSFAGFATIPGIVRALIAGEQYPNERSITIPEGWDERDIADYFAAEGVVEKEAWWAVAGYPAADYRSDAKKPKVPDRSREFSFLADKPAWVGLEGYLYPDTYRIWRDATPEDILRKMLKNFDARITPDLRAAIALQKKTIFAVITLASLVEKESGADAERPVIAGILWKRLAAGMPLQVDASVNYATGKRGTPVAADLKTPSPFNTYAHPGLPLGPIANPGIASIRATIFPHASSYLYYLHAPDERIIYSRTLEEHQAARAQYLAPASRK